MLVEWWRSSSAMLLRAARSGVDRLISSSSDISLLSEALSSFIFLRAVEMDEINSVFLSVVFFV